MTTQPTAGAPDGHPMYHQGSRAMQDRFDSRRIADRLEAVTVHEAITEDDRAFVESCVMFFLATADAQGWPDCSYKGGLPGFVHVDGPRTISFPDYDGNGMFRSLGNIVVNPRVGLLFVDLERSTRLRINGVATVDDTPGVLAAHHGAHAVVRVVVERVFPNCPRCLHRMSLVEHSVYAPQPGHVPPEPEWKQADLFRDALPGAEPPS